MSTRSRQFVFQALLVSSLITSAPAQQKRLLRWAPGQPKCLFRAGDDGVYRYALATNQLAITLAVDSHELDKARQRIEPVLGLFLSVRFLNHSAQFDPASITLEFVQHFHQREGPLDPQRLSAQLAADRQSATARAASNIRKHPEHASEIDAELKDRQRNIDQMIDFLHARMLQSSPAKNDEIAGWLLFSTSTRWIGPLNQQEEFVLRIPLANAIAEFPFTFPPSQGDVELRTRPPE